MTFPKSILIVRTDRIGDVILSIPVAALIKKHSPQTKVTFLVKDYTKPLIEKNKFIDGTIALKAKRGKIPLVLNAAMLKNKFDACIVTYPTFKIALILFLAGIETRIGTGYRWYSFLFNKKVYEHRKYGERHELEFNIRLLDQLGITGNVTEENVEFGINPSKKTIEKVKSELKSLGVTFTKPVVIIHPGSSGSSIDLPVHKMKEIIEWLSKENVETIITGSADEKELCESLVVNNSGTIINTAGKFDLENLMALIDLSDIMIANSTGPIHIAAALGKHVVGFYPKIPSCAPKRWGPYTNKKTIFSPTINCSNCTQEQCEKLDCMESIPVDDIILAVKNILQQISVEKR